MSDLPCVACSYFDIELEICTFQERNIVVDPYGYSCGDFVCVDEEYDK